MTQDYQLDHLDDLEAESIFVLREVSAQIERPAILFSGGKDSIVVTHLATKAFAPARIPMPLVHIDTGHNFPETIEFRDGLAERLGVQLVVGSVQATIDAGRVREETEHKRAATDYRLLRSSTPSKMASMTRALRSNATKRKPAPRNASSATATTGSGIRNTSAPSYGTFSTAITCPASIGLSIKQLD